MPSTGVQTCARSEEHTSELQSHDNLVCRLLLEKKNSDADRAAVVARLQAALGEGGWRLDEFGQRAGAAHAAVSRAEFVFLMDGPPPESTPFPRTAVVHS